MKTATQNILLLAAVVLLAVLPLLFVNGEFGGADGAAEEMIKTIQPSYEPWFSSLLEPPAETESMLFALQAAIGAGFIGYVIGLFRGKASKSKPQ
ncbi:energy-coupling factor ABC transporter substrate-binding protein [Paenibacillus oleatilyticus]|uniref:Cobalt transport protein CbiN n=1 Tax=Paenibacillus oleatilyticus TaxID=2594886 RepID=A0ABV4V635_9BACL